MDFLHRRDVDDILLRENDAVVCEPTPSKLFFQKIICGVEDTALSAAEQQTVRPQFHVNAVETQFFVIDGPCGAFRFGNAADINR